MEQVPTSYLGMSGSKEEEEALLGGEARVLGLGRGGTGAPDGAIAGRVGAGVCRVVALVGGTGGRVEAGAWGGGAVTLCDMSQIAGLIGLRAPWSAGQVCIVWRAFWMLPSWVVMVSS